MGVSYSAYAIVGYKVRLANQYEDRRGCKHEIIAAAKFCHECGKAAWISECVAGIERIGKAFRNREWDNCIIVYDAYSNDDWAYVGLGLMVDSRHDNRPKMVPIRDSDGLRNALHLFLHEHGLWSDEVEKTYGLWCVQIAG